MQLFLFIFLLMINISYAADNADNVDNKLNAILNHWVVEATKHPEISLQDWMMNGKSDVTVSRDDFRQFWLGTKFLLMANNLADMDQEEIEKNLGDNTHDFSEDIYLQLLEPHQWMILLGLSSGPYQRGYAAFLWDEKVLSLIKFSGLKSDEDKFNSEEAALFSADISDGLHYQKPYLTIHSREVGYASCSGANFQYIFQNKKFEPVKITMSPVIEKEYDEIDAEKFKTQEDYCNAFSKKIIFKR